MSPTRKKPQSPKPPDTPGALVDVFISYARADSVIAKNLAETLSSEGFEVWFDEKIYAGADWNSMLMSTLSSAKAILVLWSRQSVGRGWVIKEAQIGMDNNRLVPVKIDDCEVPAPFSDLQTAMMQGWIGTGPHPELERLFSGLTHLTPPSHVDAVRPGFDTSFLDCEVGLPSVTGVAQELPYRHFSVIMNPERRIAWYVAYNMQPYTKVERNDRWTPDPMMAASFQLELDDTRRSGFARGHIVSPLSVSWGTSREAQMANDQAFYWTNTAPQHPKMNSGWWFSVENWERKVTASHGKAIGFSGPVLADDDPVHREFERTVGRVTMRQHLRLPRRFWKVVLVADSTGKLQTAAFLLDQEHLVKNKRPLSLKPSDFRCSIADIERQTRLDFGETIHTAPAIP